jgi:hypothetical protein
MRGFPSPFGSDDGDHFDGHAEFVPAHLPDPGPFLADHDVLTGTEHAAFHAVTRDLFEERTVYDVTFDYNLARLNLDSRHPDAGYRYAEERGDAAVLRAEFTPTTPFCPQTHTLTVGSVRAWNDLADRHEYDLVRVRAAPSHHRADAINEELASLEAEYRGEEGGAPADGDATARDSSQAPF